MKNQAIVLGIDPGLAHTGWGIILKSGSKLQCLAYGCIVTTPELTLEKRLLKIQQQIAAVIDKFKPEYCGIETVWFGNNVSAGIATSQARGVALAACAFANLKIAEYTPKQIKLAIVGSGSAEKKQIQYMVAKMLDLSDIPKPDHSADALAAAICFTNYERI